MNSKIEPDGNFIKHWFSVRKAEAKLDQRILSLIDNHRTGVVLDEAGLLKSLIALANEMEDTNGSS